MSEPQDSSKIHIDTDWKAQVQAEKEKLSHAGSEGKSAGTGSRTGKPLTASFEALVSTLATQALFALGGIPDPRTGQAVAHLDLARYHIDLLMFLETKTKGNLSDDEQKLLASTIYELRSRYIQLASGGR